MAVREQLSKAKGKKVTNRQLLVHFPHDVRCEFVKMPLPDLPTDADIEALEATITKENGDIVGVSGDGIGGTYHPRENVLFLIE